MNDESNISVNLISKEGASFHVPKAIANMSEWIKVMMMDDDEDDDEEKEIQLPNVKADVLRKVIEFCRHHLEEPMTEIEKPLKSNTMADVVQQWYASFLDVEPVLLVELILAANYMDIKPLSDLTCATVAFLIKGKNPEEIRATFNITNDESKTETMTDALNSDVLCSIFSFLYCTSGETSKVEDVNAIVAAHNQMVLLFQAIPSWMSAIPSFILTSKFMFQKEAPFSCLLRTLEQSDVQGYGCSNETLGGTGREGIRNIFLDGNSSWNKWFDPSNNLPGYAEVIFLESQSIVGYAIKSANDCVIRDPAEWQLLVGQSSRCDYQEVHSVQNHRFERRYETHLFAIPTAIQGDRVKYNISQVLELRWGKQISQMHIVVKEHCPKKRGKILQQAKSKVCWSWRKSANNRNN